MSDKVSGEEETSSNDEQQTSKAGQAQEEEAAELSFAVTGKCLSGGNVEMMASNQNAGIGGGGGAAAAAASSSAAAALPPHPHGRSSLALTMQVRGQAADSAAHLVPGRDYGKERDRLPCWGAARGRAAWKQGKGEGA